MSLLGSLLFCQDCGSLLDIGSDKLITCDQCQATYPSKDFASLEVNTESAPSAFPSVLRQKRSIVQTPRDNVPAEAATIKERCEKCGNEEMTFHTLQLRSADEGSTVFYECPRCGYKFSTNN